VAIDGLTVAVLFNAPVVMYEGNWRQRLYIDARAAGPQRDALDSIFLGRAGGPWETLGQFVSTRLDTKFAPMHFEETDNVKRMTVPGVFYTTVKAIRGRDDQRAILSNLYNIIHGVVQVLSRGHTRCHDDAFNFTNEKTHGLYSDFSWTGISRGNPTEHRPRSLDTTGVRCVMGFCEHCEGQRFDRAQVLRVLRATRRQLRGQTRLTTADDVLAIAINAVRSLEIPHLELLEEMPDEVIH